MKFLRDSTPFTQVLFTLITIILGGIFISLTGFLFCRIFFVSEAGYQTRWIPAFYGLYDYSDRWPCN